MPRRPAKITLTKYIDSRNAAAVRTAEEAGYRRSPRTAGVEAEIRGYILSQAGRAGIITSASMPANIQRFMNTQYPAAFAAVEQYKVTVAQNAAAMQMNNNAPNVVEEHFASPEEVAAMQQRIQQVIPELQPAQAGIVAQQAIAMGGVIDVDIEDLLGRFAGFGVGGKRGRHNKKSHKRTHKRRHTKRRHHSKRRHTKHK